DELGDAIPLAADAMPFAPHDGAVDMHAGHLLAVRPHGNDTDRLRCADTPEVGRAERLGGDGELAGVDDGGLARADRLAIDVGNDRVEGDTRRSLLYHRNRDRIAAPSYCIERVRLAREHGRLPFGLLVIVLPPVAALADIPTFEAFERQLPWGERGLPRL